MHGMKNHEHDPECPLYENFCCHKKRAMARKVVPLTFACDASFLTLARIPHKRLQGIRAHVSPIDQNLLCPVSDTTFVFSPQTFQKWPQRSQPTIVALRTTSKAKGLLSCL